MRFFILFLSGLTLAACEQIPAPPYLFDHPHFFPTGYTYHHDGDNIDKDYRSLPAPDTEEIHYEYSPVANAAQLAQWRAEAFDLAVFVRDSLPLRPGPLYIEPPKIENVFYSSLDHSLRQAFTEAGFTVVSLPGQAGRTLSYNVESTRNLLERFTQPLNEEFEIHPDDPPYQPAKAGLRDDYVVFFTIRESGEIIAVLSDTRHLPAYDYVSSYKHVNLFQPVAGGKQQ